MLKANHWIVLVNGERVFECVATCSANGFNAQLLKANVQLKAGDKITIVYTKDTNEINVFKNISVSDSAQVDFVTFPIFDPAGDHAVTVKVDEFTSIHKIIIWYSERKKVGHKEVITSRIPLVYFE